MKTNSAARRIVKVRIAIICLALAAVAGMDVWLGASVVGRIGHPTGVQTYGEPIPVANF